MTPLGIMIAVPLPSKGKMVSLSSQSHKPDRHPNTTSRHTLGRTQKSWRVAHTTGMPPATTQISEVIRLEPAPTSSRTGRGVSHPLLSLFLVSLPGVVDLIQPLCGEMNRVQNRPMLTPVTISVLGYDLD